MSRPHWSAPAQTLSMIRGVSVGQAVQMVGLAAMLLPSITSNAAALDGLVAKS